MVQLHRPHFANTFAYQKLKEINKIHPTIKFTAELTSPFLCDIEIPHDCFCHQTRSVSFLDTSVSVKEGKFSTWPTESLEFVLKKKIFTKD